MEATFISRLRSTQQPHAKTKMKIQATRMRIQQGIMQTFHKLNREAFALDEITYASEPLSEISFEFGIVQDEDITYVDKKEKDRVSELLRRKTFPKMDFLCVFRYYDMLHKRKRPMRFDYYRMHFRFMKRQVEIQAFHERGPMRMSPAEVITFVADEINKVSSTRMLKPL